MADIDTQSWHETVEPITRRLDLAVTFGQDYRFNSEGAHALSVVLKRMAQIIDDEIKVRNG